MVPVTFTALSIKVLLTTIPLTVTPESINSWAVFLDLPNPSAPRSSVTSMITTCESGRSRANSGALSIMYSRSRAAVMIIGGGPAGIPVAAPAMPIFQAALKRSLNDPNKILTWGRFCFANCCTSRSAANVWARSRVRTETVFDLISKVSGAA